MKKIILVLLALTIAATILQAQRKVGLFLHGFSSNAQVGWLNSGTPDALVNEGILTDRYVPNLPVFTDVAAMTSTLQNQFIGNQPSDRWVFVGHSLGGLIARNAENPYYSSLLAQRNVQLKGIVSLGTPHQGAPVARNYAQAPDIIQGFSNDVLAGPAWETQQGSVLNWVLTALNGGRPYYQTLASSLGDAKTAITQIVEQASGLGAAELAPGSNFINSLQSIPAIVPHVSISGVEYSPAIVRWAPTIDVIGGSNPPPENEVVNKFNQAKDAYNAGYDYNRYWRDYYIWLWNITPCWLYPGSCNSYWQSHEHYQAGMDAWGRGSWALNDIDNRWFVLHNEYLEATGTYSYWVPCGEGLPLSVDPGSDLPMVPEDPCAYGADGYWVTVVYTYYYAEKSDAYIPQNRTKWFAGEGFANPNTPASALRQGNILFEAGYNHSELRNLDRLYPPYGQSEPMRFGRSWISYWINFQQ